LAKKKTTLLERTERVVDKALATLEKCVDRTSKDLLEAEEYDSTLASHLSWLTKSLVSTLEAARKLEMQQSKQAKELTPEEEDKQCRAYIADLPKERLFELMQFIRELVPEGSVL
jgi:hypothetical protein